MGVLEALDWILGDVRPLSLECQFFEESRISALDDVHLLPYVFAYLLVGLVLDDEAFQLPSRVSLRGLSLLSK